MPKVGKKHYPYTKTGKAAAKKARQKLRTNEELTAAEKQSYRDFIKHGGVRKSQTRKETSASKPSTGAKKHPDYDPEKHEKSIKAAQAAADRGESPATAARKVRKEAAAEGLRRLSRGERIDEVLPALAAVGGGIARVGAMAARGAAALGRGAAALGKKAVKAGARKLGRRAVKKAFTRQKAPEEEYPQDRLHVADKFGGDINYEDAIEKHRGKVVEGIQRLQRQQRAQMKQHPDLQQARGQTVSRTPEAEANTKKLLTTRAKVRFKKASGERRQMGGAAPEAEPAPTEVVE